MTTVVRPETQIAWQRVQFFIKILTPYIQGRIGKQVYLDRLSQHGFFRDEVQVILSLEEVQDFIQKFKSSASDSLSQRNGGGE